MKQTQSFRQNNARHFDQTAHVISTRQRTSFRPDNAQSFRPKGEISCQ